MTMTTTDPTGTPITHYPAAVLAIACPWCASPPGVVCQTRPVGFRRRRGPNRPQPMRNPHDARVVAATGTHGVTADADPWEDFIVPPRRHTGPVPHGAAERPW